MRLFVYACFILYHLLMRIFIYPRYHKSGINEAFKVFSFSFNFFFAFLPSIPPFPLPLLSCHADLNQDADLRCQSDASRVCVCVFARMNTHSMCVCMLAVNHASSEPRYPQSHGISGATQSPSVLSVTAHVPPQTDFSRFLKPEKLLYSFTFRAQALIQQQTLRIQSFSSALKRSAAHRAAQGCTGLQMFSV